MTYDGTVLVGIDENEPDRVLLDWAAEEARSRGSRLVVCHVNEWASIPYLPAPMYGDVAPDVRTTSERIIGASVDAVRAAHPGVVVAGAMGGGSPSRVLLVISEQAAMMVVGARGVGGFAGLSLGSVSAHVAAHAHCPVAVVRDVDPGATDVVVGIDGSEESTRAVDLAVSQARRTGGTLIAVHAYRLAPVAASYGVNPGSDVLSHHRLAERTLDAVLGDVEAAHPEIKVERRVTHGPAAGALLDAAVGAAALVVGARGLGGFAGLISGSVSQQVVRHARCPVLIAH